MEETRELKWDVVVDDKEGETTVIRARVLIGSNRNSVANHEFSSISLIWILSSIFFIYQYYIFSVKSSNILVLSVSRINVWSICSNPF